MQAWTRKAPGLTAVILPPLAVLGLIALIWQGTVTLGHVPAFLLPSPLAILRAMVANGRTLLTATAITAAAAVAGFIASGAVGCLIAFAFSQSILVRRAGFPYAIFLQTVPIVAIAPLIIIWFGTGFHSVVLVSFIVSLFPVVTNATTGLITVDRNLADLFRLYGATRVQVLCKLRFPAAVPYVIAGLKTSAGLSVIGAIVGEFFAGYGARSHGLGYLIIMTSGNMKTDSLFGAIFCATGLGLIIFGVTGWIGSWILNRWYREQTHE